MLQNIRDRITGKFAIAILALIALPFVFFGINYNFIGLGFAAKVNGEEISVAQFENAYRDQLLALAEQGTEIPEEFRQLVREGVLDRMIRDKLIDLYLTESGYAVSDQLVTDFIQRDPTWQEDGRFSRDAYYQWLELRAIDPGIFEASQRRALEQNQLQRGVAASAFVTPSEYRRYLNLYGEQRQVSLAEIDINALTESIEVSDEDIQAYYDARPDAYMAPESVDLAYVELRRDDLAAATEISEEEIRQYYEDSKSRYQRDEQRQARHILIPFGDDEAAAEEEATALAARAQAGEPFEDLARQYSEDSSTAGRGGDLGLLLETQLPGGLAEAVFEMEQGDIRGPVRSDFGFHVVRLDEIRSGGALPLAEVRGELERELSLEKAEDRYLVAERDLSDALFDAGSMEALAAASGLELKTATGFTRQGGEPFGSNQAAIDAIFDPTVLEDREISDIVELDANRSIVVAVTAYNEAARLPLEDVRDSIVAELRSERAFALANGRIIDIEAALNSGSTMAEAVAGLDQVTTRSTVITRQSTDVSPRVRTAVFANKKPAGGRQPVGTVVTDDRKYVVYQLTAVTPGRPESIPLAERDEGKLQLSLQSGSYDLAALISNLEKQADIVRSEDALARETLFE
jgi:peptidyl-prolyl cis-trans isomerase D